MLAKLEKLNKLITEYKQSSSDDPLLATKIADLNSIVSNLKTKIGSKRKARELAKKVDEEEERKMKEQLKQQVEAANEAEKKTKEKVQRVAEAKKKERELKPKSRSDGNVLPWVQDIMKRHMEPFLSKIPVPRFVRDMEAFLYDSVFAGLPLQYRPLVLWATIFLLTFLPLVTFIATMARGRRKRKVQKSTTTNLTHDNSVMMSPAEIQRLQMEKQALESRLKMITSMRDSNNDHDSILSPADEKQKVIDEAARQAAQSKLVGLSHHIPGSYTLYFPPLPPTLKINPNTPSSVHPLPPNIPAKTSYPPHPPSLACPPSFHHLQVEYATEAAAARSSLSLVQQQLDAMIKAKELSDRVTGEADPQYINELKKHVLELTQKRIEDEDLLISVQRELKTAKEAARLLEEQLYYLKKATNGNGNGNGSSNETALKDQLLALAQEFHSYKISSQKIIAELHLRISSSKNSSSSSSSSMTIEQSTSQQLQQQQRGFNLDSHLSSGGSEGILASESNDSNTTSKRSRFVLPPSDTVTGREN